MTPFKGFLATAALATACLAPALARAGVVEHVTMDFASGATFTGDVTFVDNLSSFTAVSGTLSGGSYGNDSINWIWSSVNASSGTDNYSNFLMDGSSENRSYSTFIQLAVNYSNPNQLVFTSGVSMGAFGLSDNYINYTDRMVSGTISSISAVPEAPTWALLALGLAAIGAVSRKKSARAPSLAA